ncbi:MAG: ribokinase [Bacteroides sp.]|nr:ribokinase [Bacteroides sp.]
MNNIAVVGSTNIDMTARVSHLPACGETVCGAEFSQSVGGKGMNQAIAAARLGGRVTLVTALGGDPYAATLRSLLAREGITADYIIDSPDSPTGVALIYVSHRGDNCIAVAPGANDSLRPELLGSFDRALAEADVVLMQAEIPYPTILATARRARELGHKVIFNLAPAIAVDAELLGLIDVLIVNEVEAGTVADLPFDGDNLDAILDHLAALGIPNVVVTVGADGAWLLTPAGRELVPSYPVKPVDTVAAGDTFCGALAVAIRGEYLTPADLRRANAAAALAVTRPGATPSIPTADEVNSFIDTHSSTTIRHEQPSAVSPL